MTKARASLVCDGCRVGVALELDRIGVIRVMKPERSDTSQRLSTLQAKKRLAVATEDYSAAAKLKAEIEQFEQKIAQREATRQANVEAEAKAAAEAKATVAEAKIAGAKQTQALDALQRSLSEMVACTVRAAEVAAGCYGPLQLRFITQPA